MNAVSLISKCDRNCRDREFIQFMISVLVYGLCFIMCFVQESQRYCDNLYEARSFGVKKGAINGIGMGTVYSISFASFGLAFWVGSILFLERDYSAGDILVVSYVALLRKCTRQENIAC